MSSENSFLLDGVSIPFQAGDTIMDAALRAEKYIPHLCHHPEFKPHGSCRVCLVKQNGREVSSCTQPAEMGDVVESDTDEINDRRRLLLQMLFVEGNHVCPGCEKSGACQLQAVAYYVGMLAPALSHFYPRRTVDASHPDIALDLNRCILCELCVRASRDIDGKSVFAVAGRGIDSRLVVNSPDGRLGTSAISIEDRAANVCPVGAILPKHQAYREPIGQRQYDNFPINVVGDVKARSKGEEGNGR